MSAICFIGAVHVGGKGTKLERNRDSIWNTMRAFWCWNGTYWHDIGTNWNKIWRSYSPAHSGRSSGNLDESQWVCGASCESAGPLENPDGSQLVCGALGVYVGPSMNLAGSQSVCGPSVNLYGFQSVVGLLCVYGASVNVNGFQRVCRARSNSVGLSTNLGGSVSLWGLRQLGSLLVGL